MSFFALRGLGSKSTEELEAVFDKIIPKDTTELDLSLSFLGYHSPEVLSGLFKKIPETVERLNLSVGHLYYLTSTYYVRKEALNRLVGSSIEDGKLKITVLEDATEEDTTEEDTIEEDTIEEDTIEESKKKIRFPMSYMLDLGEVIAALALVFKDIRAKALNLSGNFLFERMPRELLTALLSGISDTVETLDLSYNQLCRVVDSRLIQLPRLKEEIWKTKSVLTKPIDELITIFKAIKPSTTRLILKGNNLGFLSLEELKTFLAIIPPSIQYLDLSENHFNLLSEAERTKIEAAIPEHIKEFCLDGGKIIHRLPKITLSKRAPDATSCRGGAGVAPGGLPLIACAAGAGRR
jgi:hypothetical protein